MHTAYRVTAYAVIVAIQFIALNKKSMLINTIQQHLSERIESGELTNNELVQLIAHLGMYLNLQTIPDYAKENNISYNGAKKFRNVVKIFGVKFIIDNE